MDRYCLNNRWATGTLMYVHCRNKPRELTVIYNTDSEPLSWRIPQVHGNLLLGGDSAGRVCFWNVLTTEMEAAVKVHEAAVNKVVYRHGRFFTASRWTNRNKYQTCQIWADWLKIWQFFKIKCQYIFAQTVFILYKKSPGFVQFWVILTHFRLKYDIPAS